MAKKIKYADYDNTWNLGSIINDMFQSVQNQWRHWKRQRFWQNVCAALGPEYECEADMYIITRAYRSTLFIVADHVMSSTIPRVLQRRWFPGCRGVLLFVDSNEAKDAEKYIERIQETVPTVTDIETPDTLRILGQGGAALLNAQIEVPGTGEQRLLGQWIRCEI